VLHVQESSKKVVAAILNNKKPKTILDAPCGKGWLQQRLEYKADVDGIDLYDDPAGGYRTFSKVDLDEGIPESLPRYDSIVSCEGIEHIGNPALFLKTARQHLAPGGLLIITTPNVWYPEARLQYFLRGFFPGFPCRIGGIELGAHLHITPWSYPQLYLFLQLHGYRDIEIHQEPLSSNKHLFERLLALPQRLYCRSKINNSQGQVREFWKAAASSPSLYGRHLIVTATA